MIYNLYNKLKEKEENLASILVAGLVSILFYGLVFGLIYGLVNINKLIFLDTFNIIFLIIIILIISEILYLIFTKKIKNPTNSYVIKHKAESFFESLIIVINFLNIKYLIINIDWNKYFPEIIKWIGYIGIGIITLAVIVLLLWLWIKANKKLVTKK